MAFGSNPFGWPFFGQDSASTDDTRPTTDYFHPAIKHQHIANITTAQDGAASVLMEDTVYTMQSTGAVMGGRTSPEPDMRPQIRVLKIRVR